MWVASGKLGHTGVSAEPTGHQGDPDGTGTQQQNRLEDSGVTLQNPRGGISLLFQHLLHLGHLAN